MWTENEKNSLWTPEVRKEKSNSVRGNKNPNYGRKSVHRKTVEMYSLENKLMETFESIHEASIKTKINERCISGTCNGLQKTAGGFVWKFL